MGYGSDGSVNYRREIEYDTSGKETKHIKYKSDESIDYWYEYEYDDRSGHMTREIEYTSGEARIREESEYDAAGNRTKIVHYWADGSIRRFINFRYDVFGREIIKWDCYLNSTTSGIDNLYKNSHAYEYRFIGEL